MSRVGAHKGKRPVVQPAAEPASGGAQVHDEDSAPLPPNRWLDWLGSLDPRRFFLLTWQRLDREAERERAERARKGLGYDFRPLTALVVGALCLVTMEEFGQSRTLENVLRSTDYWQDYVDSPHRELCGHAYWAAWRVLGYFVVPAAVVKLYWRESLHDYGVNARGSFAHARIYVIFYLIVLAGIAVGIVLEPWFLDYYPFYREANRSWADLLTWEALYAAQFFSLEFFFRGFWLKAMRTSLGSYAIFAMMVPYCMIHIGKPFPEQCVSIIAGVALGTLAMKTRSMWNGFVIHVAVAFTMDALALVLTGRGLPTTLWP